MREDSATERRSLMKIGITGRGGNALAVRTAKKAIALLAERGIAVQLDSGFMKGANSRPIGKFSCSIVLSFGGDGTLLAAFHGLSRKIPVMGINCGSRGFLQAYGHTEIEQAVRAVIGGKFPTEQRTRIKAKVDGKAVALWPKHCVADTPGALLSKELLVFPE